MTFVIDSAVEACRKIASLSAPSAGVCSASHPHNPALGVLSACLGRGVLFVDLFCDDIAFVLLVVALPGSACGLGCVRADDGIFRALLMADNASLGACGDVGLLLLPFCGLGLWLLTALASWELAALGVPRAFRAV